LCFLWQITLELVNESNSTSQEDLNLKCPLTLKRSTLNLLVTLGMFSASRTMSIGMWVSVLRSSRCFRLITKFTPFTFIVWEDQSAGSYDFETSLTFKLTSSHTTPQELADSNIEVTASEVTSNESQHLISFFLVSQKMSICLLSNPSLQTWFVWSEIFSTVLISPKTI